MKILTNQIKKKIAYQLTGYVILFSFLTALVTTSIQGYIYYENDIKNLEKRLEQLHDNSLPAITYDLWKKHKEQVHMLLKHLLDLTEVQYISLNFMNQNVAVYGQLPNYQNISQSFSLKSSEENQEAVGTLQLVASLEEIHQHRFEQIVISLTTQAANIGLIAIFILWLLTTMVTRHLKKIADYAEHIDSEHLDTVPSLKCPGHNEANELEYLVTAINQMRFNLQQSYKNIRDCEQNTQDLLKSTLIGLGLWRLDGTLVSVNPAYAQIMGRSVSEMLKLNYWKDIVVEEDAALEQARLQALKKGDRYGPVEKEYRHKDGYYVPVRLSALIIEKEGQHYAWSNVENITEQQWAALELRKAKQKAEETNLAKSQFLANMSHELRTPMNTIVGYTEMLEEEIKECDRPYLLRDIKGIHAAAKHLLGLIDGILDISKIEAGKMQVYTESFDLKAMIQNIIATIQPLIENKANILELSCPDELGEIHTDLTKVRQILLNLLSNASKFTEQGTIVLEVIRQAEPNGDWIIFSVHDDGIGMTSEQQANLFQVFTQADASITRKYGGSGLGLALTKHFAQMLGGSIQVKSEFGKGSHFTVRLPAYLQAEKTQNLVESEVRIPDLPVESGVLLVIDDDETVRDLFQTFLSKVGYQVAVAANGEEGLKLAKKLRPNAITLDVMMPGMDGWQVLSSLKADPELAHIPVIMLTMLEDQEIGYSLGASEYLTKPISRHQLINVLRKYRANKATSSTVMIVEDDPATREMMVRMLHKEGWQVIEAENGEIALQRLQKHHADLILLDLMMPNMDGFEFIVHLRQHETGSLIPVVVLSAKDITVEDRIWLNNRVDTVFQKGAYSREELLNELRRLLTEAVSKPH